MTIQNGKLFFILTVCDVFIILVKPLYKAMLLHITSSLVFFCTLLLLRWGGCSYRRVLFSRFYLGIDSGLIVVNLVKLECVDVLFWCITHYTNYVINLEKYSLKMCKVDLLDFSNSHFRKVCKSGLFFIIYKLFVDTAQKRLSNFE